MASKKQPASKTKPKAAPAPQKGRLQNLAAKPTSFNDEPTIDDQLVDNSGVFRVTAAIQRDQIGHDDDADPRFASDSLVMAAQRDGFRERGAGLDEVTEEVQVDDDAAAALKRERLRALAARDLARRQRR